MIGYLVSLLMGLAVGVEYFSETAMMS